MLVIRRLVRIFLERRKRLITLLLVAFVGGIVFLSYFCPESLCSSVSGPPSPRARLPSERAVVPQGMMAEVDLPPAVDVAAFSDEEVW